jgi:hypothetical protein
MRARPVRVELLLVALSVGCQQAYESSSPPHAAASPSSENRLTRELAPRAASRFQERDGKQRQEYPRLPDTGEWRCAERGSVVWCAGGEAAAGVVSGPPDRGYRCGPRWDRDDGERVCIDEHPDYPAPSGTPRGDGKRQRCRFEQEQGIVRVCELAAAYEGLALPARAVPACWLDRDCPSGHCDRGACSCGSEQDCKSGRCAGGFCVEAKP